ncbi:MAG: hypothetical protein M1838_001406 [Thelocarpon superellum]|nr:MAG: hypothetical protein M1838_001406 [Thelocarpon superellum]
MSSSFEKSVKGGTKIKLAAPKSKYVEHILVATHAGEAGVAEIFRALQNRLRDSTWTIVFKSLIIVHLMIREGEADVTLKFIAANPRKLAISNFSDGEFLETVLFFSSRSVPLADAGWEWADGHGCIQVQLQGRNIRHYSDYLLERARGYKDTRVDFVRNGEGRLKRQTVEKGLLRETESVQHQINALLKCEVLSNEPENEITLTAFRLLAMDMLALFYVMNEGVINLLEHFFEMSKYDAERALDIYKTFAKQTAHVVEYLAVARHFEHATRLEVPRLKHAPTSLTGSLEEYLHDPDFEKNRRQYLAQQDVKKGRGNNAATNGANKPFDASKAAAASRNAAGKSFPSPKKDAAAPAKQEAKGPAPDLIDFFESIEQNQLPMAQPAAQQQPQQQYQPFQQTSTFPAPQFTPQQAQPFQVPGQAPQTSVYGAQPVGALQSQVNPAFDLPGQTPSSQAPQQAPLQANFTGAGFGGYTPQAAGTFNPGQTSLTNIPQNGVASFDNTSFQSQAPPSAGLLSNGQPAATNPFRQSTAPPTGDVMSQPFSSLPAAASSLTRQNTNPFARNIGAAPIASAPTDGFGGPFSASPPSNVQSLPPPEQKTMMPLTATATGTNPFARTPSAPLQQSATGPAPPAALTPSLTGSTNPFRQSAFRNQQTGHGWQQGQGTIGGLEQLPTMPVFPRPGEQPATQSQFGW